MIIYSAYNLFSRLALDFFANTPSKFLRWVGWLFGVRYFPKGDFLRDKFQEATSLMCNFPKAAMEGGAGCNGGGRERCCLDGLGGRPLQLEQARGRALWLGMTWAMDRCSLWNCTLGKYKLLGKIALVSCCLGKCLWESTLLWLFRNKFSFQRKPVFPART